MTQQEFTSRTKVEIADNRNWAISNAEFAAIHTVYMNSDLDKDAFCKAWVRMNRQRIANFKTIRKMWIEALHRNAFIAGIREGLRQHAANGRGQNHCLWYLNDEAKEALTEVGIKFEYSNVWNLISDIDDYLNKAA